MRTHRMRWMLLCAALALPVAAWAQHGQAPAGPAAPKIPAAPHAPEPSDWAEADLDEWIALGLEGDEPFAAGHGMGMTHGVPGEDSPHLAMRHMRRGAGRHGGGMGLHMRMDKLDLTDAQRDKMRELHEAAMRKNIQREADLKLARLDLHKLMRADAPSAQAVNAQIDKLSRLRADGMKAHVETYLQARALLTPEQLQKLKQSSGPGASAKGKHGSGPPEGTPH